ncbi:MAG: MFS transporter [Rhizobiales bacterium]|nr:MFS transporter [Hyphomicrobiales bacterium]
MTRPVTPYRVGIYLGIIQFIFAITWTVYVIYLPLLADQIGIPRSAVFLLLLLDQAIFTVTDFALGVVADKVSRVLGRLGYIVIAMTVLSCAAFLALPFIAGEGGKVLFLAIMVIWVVTSSALRAPPLMLIGKYSAKPSIPFLSGLSLLGLGVASAFAPYLAITLRAYDPRWPFAIASLALVLTSLGLVWAERNLAKQSAAKSETPAGKLKSIPILALLFVGAMIVLGLGYQLHFSINSAPLFRRFTTDIANLLPVFWVGFCISWLPASLLTKRFGGLAVMAGAGLLGAAAILLAEIAGALGVLVVAQFAAGAAWGCILMAATAAALAIGEGGAQGRVVGLMWSALAVATFARIAAVAVGLNTDPSFADLFRWLPAVCWTLAGAALLYLAVVRVREWAAAR